MAACMRCKGPISSSRGANMSPSWATTARANRPSCDRSRRANRPTSGRIIFHGQDVNFKSPIEAREAGIETVFQNLALADDLDVPSNLFLGREKFLLKLGPFSILDFRQMRDATRKALEKTAVKIPNLSNTIRNMSGGQRQCVAIARTATFASKLIIMDEPTAALGVHETAQVENIICNLKQNGEPLILISHNMRQVFDLADRIV